MIPVTGGASTAEPVIFAGIILDSIPDSAMTSEEVSITDSGKDTSRGIADGVEIAGTKSTALINENATNALVNQGRFVAFSCP